MIANFANPFNSLTLPKTLNLTKLESSCDILMLTKNNFNLKNLYKNLKEFSGLA